MVVDGCCCGEPHQMTPRAYKQYRRATDGKPGTMPVGSGHGAWRVPRLYITAHGTPKVSVLPVVAARYGWAEL